MPVETEIKLHLPNGPGQVIEFLKQHGYDAGPRELEVDQVYDQRSGRLRISGLLLRIRHARGKATLTYKGPANTDRHKSREELEMSLPDPETFAQILAGLGYLPAFRYEKYRTTYRSAVDRGGIVTIDETPIGTFLELEGEPDWIDRTAVLLGFTPSDYITASYAALYLEYRASHPAVPEDMRF